MKFSKINKIVIFLLVLPFLFISCKGPDGKFKLPGGDARKTPADPKRHSQSKAAPSRARQPKALKPQTANRIAYSHTSTQTRTKSNNEI